jgi:CheY-like chemotaxis protein
MKTSHFFRIGISISLLYYVFDSLLDYLFVYKGSAFMDVFILSVPANELYGRFIAIFLIIIFLVLVRLTDLKRGRSHRMQKESVFSDLNNASVVELVGHQLKTSLSTIIGFSKLMDDKEVSDTTRSIYSEHVYTSSTNLLQLFNNLVDLNWLMNDRYTVHKESCNVKKMMEELREKYEADIANKRVQQIKLKLTLPKNPKNPTLINDSKKMQKVMEKLIENAMNFTHKGTIDIGYKIKDNKIIFFVADEGAGLSLENLETAFSHYSNRKKSLDASFDLAALRVVVAKKFAELIDGSIRADSTLGEGSTYYFSVPFGEQQEELQIDRIEDGGVPDWERKKILVAEDVEPNFLLLKELLKPTKAELIWARNGREAVDYFTDHADEVDMVLMDIVMPEMDGFEAAKKIKEINNRVPILGQTAYSLEYDKSPDQMVNFNDYITKPIWYHELINSMTKYL